MTALKFSVLLCISMLTTVLYGANPDKQLILEHEQRNLEREQRILEHYRSMYAEETEIFNYCSVKYKNDPKFLQGAIGTKVGVCMRKQIKLKGKILDYAQDQLGIRSLAQGIYDDCVDYYPKNGAKRVSVCVKTRLMLDSRLDDDIFENKIYQKCDFKWRKHGPGAIDNCSRMEATYYREKGRLKD